MTTFNPGLPIFRAALLGEASVNILSGIAILYHPRWFLDSIIKSTTVVTPLAEHLFLWMGAVVIGLAVPLLYASPNTVQGIAQRRPTYALYGATEGLLVSILLLSGTKESSPLDPTAAVLMAAFLGGACALRVYAMQINPSVAGYLIGDKKSQ